MSAVTMHHFSGLAAPFVRSKGTVSGGVFSLFRWQGGIYFQERDGNHSGDVKISPEPGFERWVPGLSLGWILRQI